MRRLGRLIATHPFTAGLTALILVLALVTGPIHGPHRPLRVWLGVGPDQPIDGHWWATVTAVLFTDNLAELIVVLVLTALLVGVSERLMGAWRTALAFFATSAVGIAAGVAIQLIGSQTGEMWSRNVHHLVVLDGGIAQIAPPDELYDRPADLRVAGFVGRLSVLAPIERIDGDSAVRIAGMRVPA